MRAGEASLAGSPQGGNCRGPLGWRWETGLDGPVAGAGVRGRAGQLASVLLALKALCCLAPGCPGLATVGGPHRPAWRHLLRGAWRPMVLSQNSQGNLGAGTKGDPWGWGGAGEGRQGPGVSAQATGALAFHMDPWRGGAASSSALQLRAQGQRGGGLVWVTQQVSGTAGESRAWECPEPSLPVGGPADDCVQASGVTGQGPAGSQLPGQGRGGSLPWETAGGSLPAPRHHAPKVALRPVLTLMGVGGWSPESSKGSFPRVLCLHSPAPGTAIRSSQLVLVGVAPDGSTMSAGHRVEARAPSSGDINGAEWSVGPVGAHGPAVGIWGLS